MLLAISVGHIHPQLAFQFRPFDKHRLQVIYRRVFYCAFVKRQAVFRQMHCPGGSM